MNEFIKICHWKQHMENVHMTNLVKSIQSLFKLLDKSPFQWGMSILTLIFIRTLKPNLNFYFGHDSFNQHCFLVILSLIILI